MGLPLKVLCCNAKLNIDIFRPLCPYGYWPEFTYLYVFWCIFNLSSADIQAIAGGVFELEKGKEVRRQVKAGLTLFWNSKNFYYSLTHSLCLAFISVKSLIEFFCLNSYYAKCAQGSQIFTALFFICLFLHHILKFAQLPITFSNNGVPINLINSKWSSLYGFNGKKPPT